MFTPLKNYTIQDFQIRLNCAKRFIHLVLTDLKQRGMPIIEIRRDKHQKKTIRNLYYFIDENQVINFMKVMDIYRGTLTCQLVTKHYKNDLPTLKLIGSLYDN